MNTYYDFYSLLSNQLIDDIRKSRYSDYPRPEYVVWADGTFFCFEDSEPDDLHEWKSDDYCRMIPDYTDSRGYPVFHLTI